MAWTLHIEVGFQHRDSLADGACQRWMIENQFCEDI
jgi:hypothetical protein